MSEQHEPDYVHRLEKEIVALRETVIEMTNEDVTVKELVDLRAERDRLREENDFIRDVVEQVRLEVLSEFSALVAIDAILNKRPLTESEKQRGRALAEGGEE